MSAGSKTPKVGGPRSAARLAAVQALYQLDMSDEPKAKMVVEEYVNHRLGQEIEGDQYVAADANLFSDVVLGAWERREEIDGTLTSCLSSDWPLDRLEKLIHAIFRAGGYELVARPDVPTAVIINEYVDVAHGFYERTEASFVNGVLDRFAKAVRT
ncbi:MULTISPECIES: transcription antitermination factor NusB [Kordiimonas]|jgi:N utilization substance protein B|uniref:Transcription antitermination protein NusB n=1 Tax=Kordiimonas lacus TaxID=637679 RepID=A0A1G6W4Y6_9PROT|nr:MULTISPECIES: transcription antitermination factor NusB [Kordiimonas]SDD60884.1 NusB antitermination factor [Kordiimonas lacus]